MVATTFFFLIQASTIIIYLTLAVYVALSRSARAINLPFAVFSLIEAFNAYSFSLVRYPGNVPSEIPIAIPLRWAALALLPGIFLHMFLPLVRGRLHRYATHIMKAIYASGMVTALAAFFGKGLITGVLQRGFEGVELLDPVFNPTGILITSIWMILAIGVATYLLIYAAHEKSQARLQADARRLLYPWALILLAGFFGVMAVLLPQESAPGLSIVLSLMDRLLSIVAGLMLAQGVLRFGSPVGRPVHHRLAPVILPLVAVVIVDFLLAYSSEFLNSPLHLLRLILIGLFAGMILARPELIQRIAQWLGPIPPDDTHFAIRLHRAWESLAEGSYNIAQVAEMLLALQEQIRAKYVGVLELVDIDEQKQLTFGRWEDGPRLFVHGEPFDWPLSEETLRRTNYSTSGIPGPPSLILPIHDQQNLAGVLLIGEPIRGGVYSTGDLRLAELLSGQLSFALAHGLRLEEALGMPRKVDLESVPLPMVNVALRTFGRLDIFTHYGDSSAPRPSMRARQILAILLAAYPDPVAAESLMERLWPEHPLESAANSLYVAIYALRRALEPDLRKGAVSRYIRRESDYYRLVIDDELWVDFLEFEDLYQQGKKELAHGNPQKASQAYERAIRIYRRPFLADSSLDLPAEVEMTRHRLQRYLHEMAWHIAQESLERGDLTEAERALVHLLSVDPHDQMARQELADIYRSQGKDGLAQELETISDSLEEVIEGS
jgi:DNA-binding SARP family transcriptional activator/tryptophan-rich sensory protein